MTSAPYYWWERWGNWVIDNQGALTASLLLKQLKCFPLKCNLYLLPQQIQSKTEMQPILLQWWRVNILEHKVITEFLSTNYWLPSRTRCREVILINHSCNQAVIRLIIHVFNIKNKTSMQFFRPGREIPLDWQQSAYKSGQ